jgi:hypothetical protein
MKNGWLDLRTSYHHQQHTLLSAHYHLTNKRIFLKESQKQLQISKMKNNAKTMLLGLSKIFYPKSHIQDFSQFFYLKIQYLNLPMIWVKLLENA